MKSFAKLQALPGTTCSIHFFLTCCKTSVSCSSQCRKR